MKRSKMILLLAAAGLIGTSAGAGAAAGLTSKVSGLLRKDVIVTVDDAVTRLQPVFINGKAYLPAKDTVMQLGYELTYNASNKAITIWDPKKWLNTDGVIVSANKQDGGRFRFELIGKAIKGSSGRIVLLADANTTIVDSAGKPVDAAELKAGTHVSASYGPSLYKSDPPQANAIKLTIGAHRLLKEDIIKLVRSTDDGVQLVFGQDNDGELKPELALNAGKSAIIVTPEGQPASVSGLKQGVRVRVYYGPSATTSTPPQSPADVIIVLPSESATK